MFVIAKDLQVGAVHLNRYRLSLSCGDVPWHLPLTVERNYLRKGLSSI